MNRKRITYIILSVFIVLGLGLGIFFSYSCLDTEYQSGTIVNNGITELKVERIAPQTEGKKAAIQTATSYTEYDTIKEAYEEINTKDLRKVDITLIFFDNWIAEGEDGFGSNETAKDGLEIYTNSGALNPIGRVAKLTIDLNGYTLGRKLDNPIEDGHVLNINDTFNLTIKNGYITGGNNVYSGGGIYINYIYGGSEIYLTNLHIKNNYSGDCGGGIYSDYMKCLSLNDGEPTNVYLTDCSIYNNTAKEMGGGIFQDIPQYMYFAPRFHLINKVVIASNTATSNKDHNNYTLRGYDSLFNYIYDVEQIGEGSNVYISVSNDNKGERITNTITDKSIVENAMNYLHSDDSDRKLNIKEYEDYYCIQIVEKSGC